MPLRLAVAPAERDLGRAVTVTVTVGAGLGFLVTLTFTRLGRCRGYRDGASRLWGRSGA